jgi:hypothetical protein
MDETETYEYACFTVEDHFVTFAFHDGPTGTQPHDGDIDGTIDSILEVYPAVDVEILE